MIQDNFIQAYNKFMQHLHEIMGDTDYSMADAMEMAKTKTGDSSDLTAEEMEQVSHYVKRDLDHAADNLSENSQESFAQWLKFDVDLIENFAFESFLDLADKTRLELAILEHKAKNYHPYHSGEITGPGTFICEECGKEISFKSTSKIPQCPSCNGKTFVRS